MTPGEIHGLHKQVVDDLKEQLAAAREDARNERTRAEAAEQELRTTNALLASICEGSAGFKASSKLAAIRAHLKGVDVAQIDKRAGGVFLEDESTVTRGTLDKLLAAAREALEP